MIMQSIDPSLIVQDLCDGNNRFLQGQSIQSPIASLQKLKTFAKTGQLPKAVVLCCSDSRAPVEMIFDQDIGDLFVIRVAGNVVAPSLVGSVEFAVSTYGTRLVLVLGHSQCGAIIATLNHIENTAIVPSENIHDLVCRIKPHIFAIGQHPSLSQEEKILKAVESNVRASVSQLSHSSRLIEELAQQGQLLIIGAILNLSTGKIDFLARE